MLNASIMSQRFTFLFCQNYTEPSAKLKARKVRSEIALFNCRMAGREATSGSNGISLFFT